MGAETPSPRYALTFCQANHDHTWNGKGRVVLTMEQFVFHIAKATRITHLWRIMRVDPRFCLLLSRNLCCPIPHLGLLAPYLDRDLRLSCTPRESSVPLMMW